MNQPMANLPVVIFQFAMSPYEDWHRLAWGGAALITLGVLGAQHPGARAVPQQDLIDACNRPRTSRRLPQSEAAGARPQLLLRQVPRAEEHQAGHPRAARSRRSSARRAAASRRCCAPSTACTSSIPEQRAEGEIMLDGENMLDLEAGRVADPRARSAWCSRSRRRSRCRSTTTSPSACGCSRTCRAREMDERVEWALTQGRAVERGEGQAAARAATASPAASSSACASRAASRSSPKCCCSTSRARRSTRSRPPRSRSSSHELKTDYTVVIVTHNMQQAARVSDYTAYMYLGELIEFGETDEIFIKPTQEADRGLHHRAASAECPAEPAAF